MLPALTQSGIAAALGISTRQVQRLNLPHTPVGTRGKRYDLAECKQFLRDNHPCQSSARLPAGRLLSASTIADYTDACRRVHLRVMPKP